MIGETSNLAAAAAAVLAGICVDHFVLMIKGGNSSVMFHEYAIFVPLTLPMLSRVEDEIN